MVLRTNKIEITITGNNTFNEETVENFDIPNFLLSDFEQHKVFSFDKNQSNSGLNLNASTYFVALVSK